MCAKFSGTRKATREACSHAKRRDSLVAGPPGIAGVDVGKSAGDPVGGEAGMVPLGSRVGVVAPSPLQHRKIQIFLTIPTSSLHEYFFVRYHLRWIYILLLNLRSFDLSPVLGLSPLYTV
jgi:hypothetical protein